MKKLFGAPTYLDDSKPTIDLAALHQKVLVLVGLAALLDLQYTHEGHRDEHVVSLHLDTMLSIELELSNVLHIDSLSDMPF